MKHSLDLNIVCNDETTTAAILSALPQADDLRVWADQYEMPTQSVDETGDSVLSGMIRFNEDADRADVDNVLKSIAGMFALCEPGSYLRLHTCHHDEDPPQPCEVTTLYEVIEE